MSARPRGKRRGLWIALAAALILAVGAYLALTLYAGGYARAGAEAEACLASGDVRTDGLLTFGARDAETGLILYPGGLVDEAAYAPLAAMLADAGVLVCIPSMPYHLAVFGADAAAEIMPAFPEISRWYVGGHSLGGAMAASFAADEPEKAAGLILLAAYASKPVSVPALSVYGSLDTVLNRETYEKDRGNLPADTTELVIEGGNHAQFGDYGAQAGDSPATITPEAQRRAAADAILAFLERTRG